MEVNYYHFICHQKYLLELYQIGVLNQRQN